MPLLIYRLFYFNHSRLPWQDQPLIDSKLHRPDLAICLHLRFHWFIQLTLLLPSSLPLIVRLSFQNLAPRCAQGSQSLLKVGLTDLMNLLLQIASNYVFLTFYYYNNYYLKDQKIMLLK